MATPYDGVAQECSGRLRRARGAQEGSGGLGTAREASKMTKMQNCIQIIVKSCKSVGRYAKVGGSVKGPAGKSGKSVKHSSKMQLFIIWQIMKSCKSIQAYAKVGGWWSAPPLAKVAKV